jgi:hypothetical protein
VPLHRIETLIKAPPHKLFDLCLDIDVHQAGISDYKKEAFTGVIKGIISLGEILTWRAKHYLVFQILTEQITEVDSPDYFSDEKKVFFKRFKYSSDFECKEAETLIIDLFYFNSLLVSAARFVDKYITKLLIKNNEHLRKQAKS